MSGSRVRNFARHFVEMLVAMLIGMAIVGLPAAGILALAGTSWSSAEREAPALIALLMGVGMTAPMAAWMGHRGQPRVRIAEMVAAMALVTVAIIGLEAGGAVGAKDAVGAQHPAMIVAMIVVMLARHETYSRALRPSHI